jgi:hypothetical protein
VLEPSARRDRHRHGRRFGYRCRMLTDAGARRRQAIVTDFDDAGGHVLMDRVKLRGGEAMFLPIDLHEVAKLGVPLGSAVQAQGIANGVPIASAASSDITGTDVHLVSQQNIESDGTGEQDRRHPSCRNHPLPGIRLIGRA